MRDGKRVQVDIPAASNTHSSNDNPDTHHKKKGCSSCGKPATWLIILLSIVALIVFIWLIYAILKRGKSD